MNAPTTRTRYAIVMPGFIDERPGPLVTFYDEPRWAIDLLCRHMHSNVGQAVSVWSRKSSRAPWELISPDD